MRTLRTLSLLLAATAANVVFPVSGAAAGRPAGTQLFAASTAADGDANVTTTTTASSNAVNGGGSTSDGNAATVTPAPTAPSTTPTPNASAWTSSPSDLASSNGLFMATLYPFLVAANGANSNLIASPFSLSSVLSLLFTGAQGQTREQLRDALFLPDDDQAVKEGYQALIRSLSITPDVTLNIANGMFVSADTSLLDSFVEQSMSYFMVSPETMDFSQASSTQTINAWVEDQTGGKITQLIPDGAVDALTRMVLVNAVYFKGRWAVPFDPQQTRSEQFRTSSNQTISTPMMHITGEYKSTFSDELHSTILEMPYEGGSLSMLFFLPKTAADFDSLEQGFSSADLANLNLTAATKFDVSIPQFKIESSLQLVQPLQSLGLTDMFDETLADLSGVTGQRDLFVSDVMQKTFVEVNEEGSEAAAATGVVISARALTLNSKFICNRPFLFAIRETATGLILFNGRVVDPTLN